MRAAILYLTYNRKLYSEKSIQSILDHTDRSKFDLLLWDNGSNDPKDMKDWLKSLASK